MTRELAPLSLTEWDALCQLAVATAGSRAGLVLRAITGKVFVDPFAVRSALHFDERTFRIDRLVYGQARCPYVMVHEFGHAYHCYYFPILSALMTPPDPRAEAVAHLFELELQAFADRHYVGNPPKGRPGFAHLSTSTWKGRQEDLRAARRKDQRPFDIVEKVLQTGMRELHSLVEAIVNDGG